MKTKLSIIIPTWNTAKITLKCVQTIKKHLSDLKSQIIVVDNASTDNTEKLLNIKGVDFIKNPQNYGFSKACNIGAKKAVGDYLLFLNSDMELIDNSLENMFKYFRENPQIGLIGPQFLDPDHGIQASVFPPQTILNAIKEFWLGKPTYSKYTPKIKTAIPVWAVSGGAVLVKNNLFKKIGGWDEKYFMYFEDLDLCRKIHQLDKQVVYYPQAKLIHRHGASGKKLADPQNQWRRLIPSAKKYHGIVKYYLLFLITRLSQKLNRS
ncbi:glycosyltransferase family 2 protein [Patescibacteria group bacterium]|nr:glycosyltransferase family 2 protein [Patescibacteria group bacterium]